MRPTLVFANSLPHPAKGSERVWRKTHNEELHNFQTKFSTNIVSDLSFITYRPELEDSIKIRVTKKA